MLEGARADLERLHGGVVKRIAFVTRYTSIGLVEALECDRELLLEIAIEVGEMIRQENTPRKGLR